MKASALAALLTLAALGAAAAEEALPPPGERFRDCADCPEMVVLPPGTFILGKQGGRRAEAPATPAAIDAPFAIARTETTFDQYQACVDDGGCAEIPWDRDWGRADRPAIYVTFDEAQAYADWLAARTGRAYRLPSEREWEYAALGGAPAPSTGAGIANCDGCLSAAPGRTLPVGSLPPNGFGLHDMLGNVMEWTRDCWRPSHAAEAAQDCRARVRKGGSWYFDRTVSTPSYRASGRLTHEAYDVGFRVVATTE
ncbi:MAG: SUMF1/EgtB/PvdO family nonheme iron enzyme [Marivibrio sp.]|uniref:formylglycine-generating enzyme family protein n=1 Tax=Marivibrio sp. TaxID=2039719 RepID=UPI0032EF8954